MKQDERHTGRNTSTAVELSLGLPVVAINPYGFQRQAADFSPILWNS
jgi:hypothetical protein